jgi:hypothetical protein
MRTNPDMLCQCPEALESWLVGCSDLIVSDERCKWITEKYPPEDVGRPMLFAVDSHRGPDRVRIPDVGPLAEDAIEDGEFELAMAAD